MSTTDRLTPIATAELSPYSQTRLAHLTDGRTVYIPGAANPHPFRPLRPATTYRHPHTVLQLPLLAGTFDTLLPDTETWLISLAHIAHVDCPACATTWAEARRCFTDLHDGTQLFRTVATDGAYLLLHCEDQPL